MIHRSYADLAAEVFAASDYPALKHFWPIKPGTFTDSLVTDVVAGADLDIAGAAGTITASGNGASITAAAYAAAAALTAPGAGSCLLIACGTWGATTSGLSYGNITATGGLSVGNASAGAKLFDGTTTKTASGTQTASAAFSRWATVRSVAGVPTELMMGETNSATLDAYTNTADLTAATAITDVAAVAQSLSVISATATLFGIAFFKFAGALPPKEVIQAAVAWLDYQWRNGSTTTMYPGFKGIA